MGRTSRRRSLDRHGGRGCGVGNAAGRPLRVDAFYLHTFLPEQPDVNWRCTALRGEM